MIVFRHCSEVIRSHRFNFTGRSAFVSGTLGPQIGVVLGRFTCV